MFLKTIGATCLVLAVGCFVVSQTAPPAQSDHKTEHPKAASDRIHQLESRVAALEAALQREVRINPDASLVEFPTVVVNLKGHQQKRYFRIAFTIKIDEANIDAFRRSQKSRMPVLKDWLIGHLSERTADSFTGKRAQNELKTEIVQSFNELLGGDVAPIKAVFLREYSVQ